MKNIKNRAITLLIGALIGAGVFSIGNLPTAKDNKLAGETFLTENTKKENIITTPSGLQYEILAKGKGPSPLASDKVTVHYKGTTLDGDEFDSSYERDEPTSFKLNHVISGWTEGLQLMNIGAKYRFFIPSELAYGSKGAGGSIGPDTTLIFEIELLSF